MTKISIAPHSPDRITLEYPTDTSKNWPIVIQLGDNNNTIITIWRGELEISQDNKPKIERVFI